MEIAAVPFTHQTEVVSKKLFDNHMTLYKGYVDKTNEIGLKLAASTSADLNAANTTYSTYRGLKRGESFALDGVILHELYFQNLVSEKSPVGNRINRLLDHNWGSFDVWKDAFVASAKTARGWCILAYEQRTKTCRNIVLDSHDDGLVCGAYPLLVLDMYEHAYMVDYGTDKAAYINKFVDDIPWGVVERRAGAVMR
ncbi:MAG: Fe-Mn family superoxide dismutase [Defluviitaleaceae bacterium]|nr:Fe-Mn family superoxide dismutase [Defluviitaleaceae bacterium]